MEGQKKALAQVRNSKERATGAEYFVSCLACQAAVLIMPTLISGYLSRRACCGQAFSYIFQILQTRNHSKFAQMREGIHGNTGSLSIGRMLMFASRMPLSSLACHGY